MRVKMVEEREIAVDGITVERMMSGSIVDLSDASAEALIELGVAVEAKSLLGPAENKDAGASPENKASGSSVSGRRKPRQARGDV